MKFGRVSESVYKRSIWNCLNQKGGKICQDMGVGMDACIHSKTDGIYPVTSVATVTGVRRFGCRIALNRAINYLAAAGAFGKSAWVTFLMPDWFMESDLRTAMEELRDTAEEIGVEISGVYAETLSGVESPVVTVSAYGEAGREERVSLKQITAGMDIVMTKEAGTEGAVMLAFEQEEKLLKRFTPSFLDQVQRLLFEISSVEEAKEAVSCGVRAMHVVGEGGVFGALWEIGEAAGVGMEVDWKQIPIRQEVIEVCEFFSINPYQITSAGSLLMVTEDGYDLAEKLRRKGFAASVIGHILAGKNRVVLQEGERRFLEPPKMDELRKGLKEEKIGG